MSSANNNNRRSQVAGKDQPKTTKRTHKEVPEDKRMELPPNYEEWIECLRAAVASGDLQASLAPLGAKGEKVHHLLEQWTVDQSDAARIYDTIEKKTIASAFAEDPFLSISTPNHKVEDWMRKCNIEIVENLASYFGQDFNEQRRVFQKLLAAKLFRSAKDLRLDISNDRNNAYTPEATQFIKTVCTEYIAKYADPTMMVPDNFILYARERLILATQAGSQQEAEKTGSLNIKELASRVYGLDNNPREHVEGDLGAVPAYRRRQPQVNDVAEDIVDEPHIEDDQSDDEPPQRPALGSSRNVPTPQATPDTLLDEAGLSNLQDRLRTSQVASQRSSPSNSSSGKTLHGSLSNATTKAASQPPPTKARSSTPNIVQNKAQTNSTSSGKATPTLQHGLPSRQTLAKAMPNAPNAPIPLANNNVRSHAPANKAASHQAAANTSSSGKATSSSAEPKTASAAAGKSKKAAAASDDSFELSEERATLTKSAKKRKGDEIAEQQPKTKKSKFGQTNHAKSNKASDKNVFSFRE